MYLVNTYQPTLSSNIFLKELTNKNYLDINKYIASNDNEGLSNFLNDQLGLKDFNIFDKFFALIYLRLLCISPTIKLSIQKDSILTINLTKILQRLLDNIQEHIEDFYFKDLQISFKLPKNLFYSNFLLLLLDIIEDIKLKNNSIDYKNFTPNKKILIIKSFKKEIIKEIKNHIKEKQNYYKIVDLEENIGLDKYNFSFYDNSAFFTLKFLFKNNLTSIYNKLYVCSQKLNLNYDNFCSITPAETNILLTIFKKSNNIK